MVAKVKFAEYIIMMTSKEAAHSFYNQSLEELSHTLHESGFKQKSADEIFRLVYKRFNPNFEAVDTLSRKTIDFISTHYRFDLPKIVKVQNADDNTVKFLVELADGNQVESVLIPFAKKYTICLSSQVGCAMKCSFCFTGLQGLKRNLEASEIIGQYIVAYKWLRENRPEKIASPNIVFMGQGEPLHNFDQVKKAIEIFLTTEGLHLGFRQITLSTAGYLPGLERFSELPNINLALSLHSPIDEDRNKLIPLNKRYSLEKLFEKLDQIKLLKRQFITYEYLLIKDLNDRDEDITLLNKWLGQRRAIINIIPFNEFPGAPYKRPLTSKVNEFKTKLERLGLTVKVRTTKGSDILAACGQLNTLQSKTL
ncbi:dual-specificity RNA methyltransferase RlmN [Halobacteriovorax marinus]|uniref:23S rRNA (adenine(2503)-C(2))-methyltransferase RlmN n=1 Tax=Halobacteriovorax marinus TaxID=97084 RepID=UPI000BDE6322|nr:23S rRNA (adenine(2503)-C(2))-methyltransferase RlmN [Halobacteriovorax marinus]